MGKYKDTIEAALDKQGPEMMCDSWREWIKDRHPELFESEFKVGDWVTVLEKPECWSSEFTDNNPLKAKLKYPYTMRIDKVDNEGSISYLANGYGWTNENFEEFWKARKATKEEIETHLIKEAKKRGLTAGAFINQTKLKYYDRESKKITTTVGPKHEYSPTEDIFYVGNSAVYQKGQWAEIIKTISKKEAEKQLGKKIVG